MIDVRIYDSLAALLEYPVGEWRSHMDNAQQVLGAEQGDATTSLNSFAEQTGDRDVGGMQELFTRTFDTNPATALEVGWHLFGESYNRGAFLVRMRGELRKYGLAESTELPDHLAHVLAVLGRMDKATAVTFATTEVLPAVGRMIEGVQKIKSPYENVLCAIQSVLTEHFGPAAARRAVPAEDMPQELSAEGKESW